jgi:putative two-component system protein, hydrogenase maturation factor HypX/HoxX
VGELTIRAYNGAMSTRQCRRIASALRTALRQDTRVLVVRGTTDQFCNGIHLGMIEGAVDPATEAWANIRAINAICRRICGEHRQLVLCAYTANAGAGGAMLGLGADVTVARAGTVLNPYYNIGLYGSELHTFTLPQRVGRDMAASLLADKLPIDAAHAYRLGLLDAVGPRDPAAFDEWLTEFATRCATMRRWPSVATAKSHRTAVARRPLSYYETAELAEMARDIFDDRNGFAESRRSFLYKQRSAATATKLAA